MKLRVLIAAAALLAAGVATAQETPPKPADAEAPAGAENATPPEAAPQKEEKRECRSQGGTGSRIARRTVCKTQSEWRAEDEASRNSADEYSRRRLPGCARTGGSGC